MLPLLLFVCWFGDPSKVTPATPHEITMWLVTTNPDGAVARGAQMGAEEMARTTTLLGRAFVLRVKPSTSSGNAAGTWASLARGAGPTFVLLDLDETGACAAAQQLAGVAHAIVMSARIPSAPCAAPMLSLRAPLRTREVVLKEATAEGTGLGVDEWHGSLQRFGAQELNERYQRRFRTVMDGDAWAGWFAAKAATEAALRLERPTRAALVGTDAPTFDGHKGVGLRFGPSGVLEQPLYLIDVSTGGIGKVVREVP